MKGDFVAAPDILLDPHFLLTHVTLFDELRRSVNWDESMRARMTASFGKPYDYSQMSYTDSPLPACLIPVQKLLLDRLQNAFNNCLLNYYQTGRNRMGFHSDEIHNLQPGTGVAIVSLGSPRSITFRSIDRQTLVDYDLGPGSLLYMGQEVQRDWQHAIPKQESAGPRISLTWRAIR